MPGHGVRVEQNVHDRRLSRRKSPLERGRDLGRTLDILGMTTENLAKTVVAAGRQAPGDLAFVAVDPDLRDPDLAPGAVVPDHEDGRERETDERVEVEPVEAESAVTQHADHA